jgi:hypothetical protein
MARKGKWLFALVPLGLAWWVLWQLWDYFDHSSPAHLAIQYWLKTICESEYEYHSQTGKWAASLDDLATTSLPARFPLWRSTAENMVILWPKDLNRDPKENRSVILAYYRVGLYSKLGHMWVCWGDLRTEFMDEKELRARVASLQHAKMTGSSTF